MNIFDFFNDNFWIVATMISTLILSITSFISSKFELNGVWKQVVAWGISALLTVGVYFGNLATFNEPAWLSIILTAIVCGLCANGIYDIPVIKKFITKYFSVLPVKK